MSWSYLRFVVQSYATSLLIGRWTVEDLNGFIYYRNLLREKS